MTRRIMIYLFISLVIPTATLFSQEKSRPEKSGLELVDEFGYFACSDLNARLDFFASALFRAEDRIGFVVISAGTDDALRVLRLSPMIYNHLVNSGIDTRRFEILRSGPTKELKIQFWLSIDSDVKPPIIAPDYDFTMPAGTRPFIAFGWEGDECPGSNRNNSNEFKELLNANPGAKGNIVIHGPSRVAFDKMKKLVADSLPDIPSSRLRYFFVADKTIKEEFTWAEYWIVPKKK